MFTALTIIYAVIWVVTLAFGFGVVLSKRADHSAFNLMGVMAGLAANFIVLGFQFIGFIQLIVYIGAIMVLFLFVIMLLNLREPEGGYAGEAKGPLAKLMPNISGLPMRRKVGLAFAIATAALLIFRFAGSSLAPEQSIEKTKPTIQAIADADDPAGVSLLASELLETWIIPFEVSSLLLLAAVIGAIVVAQQRRTISIDTTRPASAIKNEGGA